MKDARNMIVLLLIVVAFGVAMVVMMGLNYIPTAADPQKPLSQLPAQGEPR